MPAIKQTQIFDWNSVKDALFFSVSTDNEEYRKEAPHRTVGEFTLNYNVLIEDGKGHSKASKIGMQALKVLNITEEDLYNATIESAPKLFPVSDNVFGGVARISTEQYTDRRLDDGATAIFYPDVLDHYAEMMGGKIYVLPTTKNDVIVIQDDGKYRKYEEVVKAVKDWDIYRSHGEKLTDNIYHYDAETKKFILGEEYVYSKAIERLQKAVQMYEYVELTEEERNEYLPSDIALREIDKDGYIPLMYTVDETKLGRELQISYNVPEQQMHYFVCRSLVKAEKWSIDEMIAYLEDEPDKTWEDLYDKAIDAEIRTGINVDEDSINDIAECQKEDEAILKKAELAALQERKLLLGENVVQSSEKNEQSDKSANQTADFYFLSDVRKRYEWDLADDVMKGCTDTADAQNFENDVFIRDNIKEKNKTNKNPGILRLIADAFAQIFGTIKKIATKDKKVGLFLVAFFLYIDGVGTIIDNCINIGTDLKLDSVGQVVFLLFTQVVACIGSLVFGKLSQKYKTTTLLYVCIAGYFAVCLYALTLHDLIGFGIMAFGVGCFQGSLQALSRSYFSKIIPPENSGEYFGIYDIFAKGASFLGSLVIAAVKLAGGTINVAGSSGT